MPGTPVVVKHWQRFGHDRLYVTGPAGEILGWADLKTGSMHPELPEHLAELSQATADWRTGSTSDPSAPLAPTVPEAAHEPSEPGVLTSSRAASEPLARDADWSPPPSMSPVQAAVPVTPSEPERPWSDLASTAPGAAARARARALRDAAPVRTFVARMLNLRTPERAWRIGADGEELVGAELARLVRSDPRWRVLHAVPVGAAGADIDHLVMGPGGIFTLNTKHHPAGSLWVGGDTFLVNGERQPYVRNSRHEAARAARLLTGASGLALRVEAVIVPVNARRVTVKTAPSQVAVIPRERLVPWLVSRGRVVDDRVLTIVTEAARRSTTWQSGENRAAALVASRLTATLRPAHDAWSQGDSNP
ncbi:nuclease-related domain-containing protein [Friedmanniella luteola]|uniref:nuclease-related domain-containing protein n=1 Tax=Friedmanniella luteola TaxID=546871 RepID=UPI0018D28E27|nr:nuclease-related domain-containing protein [Friedmanniella luteola]